ncbi:MAG: hypothetical protein JW870_19190 [Candidatus Delongbacteria bacterium]|nr:hypothetical protein [Candidatus Delongbacteria bacterium]
MDKETLTNHISKLGKHYFDVACKIVLRDIFELSAINVDGKNDGGTDFSELDEYGKRTPVAYQITTQKTAIKNKAYNDAKKTIKKLGVNRYYFLTTYILSETELRKLENKISSELEIQSVCMDASTIASLILEENKLNKFLDETNAPLPSSQYKGHLDYRELALHSYTLLSSDSKQLKENIYDDTILFILSNNENLSEAEILEQVDEFLELDPNKEEIIKKRIGALFGKQKLAWSDNGNIELKLTAKDDIKSRKEIYQRELSNLVAAQTDLLADYKVEWKVEDSVKISVWLADTFITQQISNLKEIKASIVAHPIFSNFDNDGINKLKRYLLKKKNITPDNIEIIISDLLELASSHPLITKIVRASMYLALQGSNPISSAKALGASRWSEFNILLEPTSAIPYICSSLFKGNVNRYFDNAVLSVSRAKKLDSKLYIPFFYINECAGHLLHARKYCGLELNENELIYSGNAFVSNYYALKQAGIKVPEDFMDYLAVYSSAIRTEKGNIKNWVRELMTDIQSILNQSNVEFVSVPFYDHEKCKFFEEEYVYHLSNLEIEKPSHLINHDIWALQFTNDKIVNDNEHWIILTFDRSLIAFGKTEHYKGWITNPIKFLDITEARKALSENKFISLLHTVATYSEQTLSVGARIMDRIIMYASKEVQNWEFKQEIEKFKQELISSTKLDGDYQIEVDKRTDEFLKKKGIEIKINEDEAIDD